MTTMVAEMIWSSCLSRAARGELGDDGGVDGVAENRNYVGFVVDTWRQHWWRDVERRSHRGRERSQGTCCPPCWGVPCSLCPKVGTDGKEVDLMKLAGDADL